VPSEISRIQNTCKSREKKPERKENTKKRKEGVSFSVFIIDVGAHVENIRCRKNSDMMLMVIPIIKVAR